MEIGFYKKVRKCYPTPYLATNLQLNLITIAPSQLLSTTITKLHKVFTILSCLHHRHLKPLSRVKQLPAPPALFKPSVVVPSQTHQDSLLSEALMCRASDTLLVNLILRLLKILMKKCHTTVTHGLESRSSTPSAMPRLYTLKQQTRSQSTSSQSMKLLSTSELERSSSAIRSSIRIILAIRRRVPEETDRGMGCYLWNIRKRWKCGCILGLERLEQNYKE